MVQRVIANAIEVEEAANLQKIGQKFNKWSNHLLIELPELNTALIDVYQELARMAHAAKDMPLSSKHARKQAH